MVIGIGILLGTRLLLLLLGVLAYLGTVDAHILLPVSDRAIMAFGLILILWLWAFPEPSRIADAASSLLGMFILTVFIFNQIWWGIHYGESAFNSKLTALGWEVIALILLLTGSVMLLGRRPNGWGYGLVMMSVLALGHFIQMLVPDLESDYPGVVRLFEMASFPLLWAIPTRFNLPITRVERIVEKPTQGEERRQFGILPGTFLSILGFSTLEEQETAYPKLSKLLAETLLADISLIILPGPSVDLVTIVCGYDLIRETPLGSASLSNDKIPMLISAMEHMRSLRLPASSTSLDLESIGKSLDIGRTGHLLAAFVPNAEGDKPEMGIILISPYTDRRWNREDQAFLDDIVSALSLIKKQADEKERLHKELEMTQHNLSSFQTLLQEIQAENTGLRDDISNISKIPFQEQKETLDLITQLHESQDIIKKLQKEQKSLEKHAENFTGKGESMSLESAQLEEELRLALTEIAQLKNQLSDTESQLINFQESVADPKRLSDDQIEVFTSVVQELRQPLSSIIGYTDLLLGESVGILGALQRKFLDRIKASTERMDNLVEDLFQIVTLDTEGFTLRPEPVDLGNVIDKAISDARNQLQERGIVIRVDFPDEMPQIVADRDALEQVLIQLLKNAGTATPENGEILLRASTYQTEDTQDYVLMQVADQGGGIPKEDLPRVFSRLYRADNPLIQGIGDTGVGLSIVKALVEAHNGRIWVDTEVGKGSTFSLLIPLSHESTVSTGIPNVEGSSQ